ncbi:hypothetical protein GF325_04850 [Candidatus Bathyarchaeota archaeon]|nr:hypothetical protein [Candidatus Bathyarchaeota archaeon]
MKQVKQRFDMLFIGHVAKDVIEVSGKRVTAAGGGVYYGSIAALMLGASVGIITRCRKEDAKLLDPVRQMGGKVFIQTSQETSGIHNIYLDETMETRQCHPLGFAGLIDTGKIPAGLQAKYIVVAPIMAGEVDIKVLKFLHGTMQGNLCLDIQGFVRVRQGTDLVFRDWRKKQEGLAMVRILKMDRAEARNLSGMNDIEMALRKVATMGPSEIILTHEEGVTLVHDGEIITRPWRNISMSGRTGRGDTTFASYIASKLHLDPGNALTRAAAVASMKMNNPGPITATLDQVKAFQEKHYS